MKTLSYLVTALAACLAGSADAQDRVGPEARRFGPTHELLRDGHGQLRAVGPDYKARFDAGAMTFVPALGDAVPHNMDWRVSMRGTRRGDGDELVAIRDAMPRPADSVVRYARGRGIEEQFHVGPDGIEVRYVFAQPIIGEGDLVVRAEVDTELVARSCETDAGLAFRIGNVGGVNVGGVVGIDANGQRMPGSMRWDGRDLEFVLPAEFVDGAAYPLTLDPLVGAAIAAGSSPLSASQPDVAFVDDWYVVVWEEAFSETDHDVRAQFVDDSGTLQFGFWSVHTTAGFSTKPRVAAVRNGTLFLVTWATAPTPLGPFDVECKWLELNGVRSNLVEIAAMSANEIEPDVGGSATANGDAAVVVWNEVGAGIRAAQVTVVAPADPVVGNTAILSTNPDDGRPEISHSGGSTGRYAVAFERGGFPTGVWARGISGAAVPLGTEIQLAGSILGAARPSIDGDGTSFVCVYEQRESIATTKRDILCQRIGFLGNQLNAFAASGTIEADGNDDEWEPAIAWTGPKYVVAWSNEATGFLESAVRSRGVLLDGCTDCGDPEFVVDPEAGVRSHTPRIGSKLGGNVDSEDDDALIAYASVQTGPPFDSDVLARRWRAFSGGSFGNVSGPCGPVSTIALPNGPAALGNENFTLSVDGIPPTLTAAVVHLAQGPAPIVQCIGVCPISDPGFLLASVPPTTFGAGSATLDLPLACDSQLEGLAIDCQFLFLGAQVSPCFLVPSLVGSPILRLVLDY